jgi:hypothetical protein
LTICNYTNKPISNSKNGASIFRDQEKGNKFTAGPVDRRSDGEIVLIGFTVIGRFPRDADGVRMTLDEAGVGDSRQTRFRLQLFKVTRPGIAHARPQTSHQLIQEIA